MKVPGFGPERARIMLVGEAPGEDEDRAGRPFVGKAGQKLRQHLMEEGIDPLDCFLTNICQIRPPGNQLDKFFLDGGIPTEPVLEGIGALIEEIRRVQPNIIVACGNYALWALTRKAKWVDYQKDGKRIRGFTGIQTWRGSLLPCTLVEGFKVLPTYHPSYILRSMSDHGTFKCDLAKAKEEAAFPLIQRPQRTIILAEEQPKRFVCFADSHGKEYEFWADAPGLDRSDLRAVWELWPEDRETIKYNLLCDLPPAVEVNTNAVPLQLLTTDVELTGNTLHCVGVTNRRDLAIVIPTRTARDFAYTESILMSGVGINAQNSMFDGSVLEWHFGWEIMSRVRFDTMFAAHSAEIELPKGLDYLASIHTGLPYWKDMVDWKLVKNGKQDSSITFVYNGEDVWSQHAIAEEQIRDQLTDEGVRRTFEFEMALLLPLWHMSRRGIRIDLSLIEEKRQELQGETARIGMELLLMAGRPINPRPSNDCTWFLYDRMGLPVLKRTKSGPSTDDKTLAALAIKAPTEEQRRAVTLVRQYRTAANLMSKFFDLEFDNDKRMRGHYDPTKTVTGRLASRKFYPTGLGTNQQNIPRDKRARRAFVADPGKIFFYADLERAESLVVAHLTGDPRMLADHAPGVDAHKSLAAALYHLEIGEVTEDQRYIAKKTRHAGNYMQGALTFMNMFNQDAHKTGLSLTFKEAQDLIKTYRDLHPFMQSWWKNTEKELWRTRTLFNLLGRRRVFYGHISSTVPEAVAFVPQSTVGDTLNVGFLNMEGIASPYLTHQGLWPNYEHIGPELKECGLECLMQIHDAIAGQVNEKDAERAFGLIREAMVIPLRNPRTYEMFRIPVEILADLDRERVALGKSNWGDVSAVKFT